MSAVAAALRRVSGERERHGMHGELARRGLPVRGAMPPRACDPRPGVEREGEASRADQSSMAPPAVGHPPPGTKTYDPARSPSPTPGGQATPRARPRPRAPGLDLGPLEEADAAMQALRALLQERGGGSQDPTPPGTPDLPAHTPPVAPSSAERVRAWLAEIHGGFRWPRGSRPTDEHREPTESECDSTGIAEIVYGQYRAPLGNTVAFYSSCALRGMGMAARAGGYPDPCRMEQRRRHRDRQIALAKNRVEYLLYRKHVPLGALQRPDHPITPPKTPSMGVRAWRELFRRWRHALHRWEPRGARHPSAAASTATLLFPAMDVASHLVPLDREPELPPGTIEPRAARVRYRSGQVARAKERLEYRLYRQSVPLEDRVDGHPLTPPLSPDTPVRSWRDTFRRWRVALHRWHPGGSRRGPPPLLSCGDVEENPGPSPGPSKPFSNALWQRRAPTGWCLLDMEHFANGPSGERRSPPIILSLFSHERCGAIVPCRGDFC